MKIKSLFYVGLWAAFLAGLPHLQVQAGVGSAPLSETYQNTRGGAYSYSIPDRTLIGTHQTYAVRRGESLYEIARSFGLGIHELQAANPGVDPLVPSEGTRLDIPTSWILPRAVDEGIVINLAEMRLYYFFQAGGTKMVKTFPIGIGREGFSTPSGVTRVSNRIKDPVWFPPPSARLEDPSLPGVVPPGPENPLGGYWLQLSAEGYGIHGTNKPWGIGQKVSRGCIRLYPEDIAWLFESAGIGMRVEIVDQPVKLGYRNEKPFIQIHAGGRDSPDYFSEAIALLEKVRPALKIDRNGLRRILDRPRGIAVPLPG